MFNRNTSKIGSLALVLALVVSAVGVAFAGGAAATDTDVTILVHEETPIDNETASTFVDITGADTMDGNGPIAVNVTVEGLNETEDPGNGTLLVDTQKSVTAGNVSSVNYDFSETETTEYDSVYVEVNVVTDGEESYIASTDWGVLADISGGGGGDLGGSLGGVSIPVIGALAIGGYFLMGRD